MPRDRFNYSTPELEQYYRQVINYYNQQIEQETFATQLLKYIEWTDNGNYNQVFFGNYLQAVAQYVGGPISISYIATALSELDNRLYHHSHDLIEVYNLPNVHEFSLRVQSESNTALAELNVLDPGPLASLWEIVYPVLQPDHFFIINYVDIVYFRNDCRDEIFEMMAANGYEVTMHAEPIDQYLPDSMFINLFHDNVLIHSITYTSESHRWYELCEDFSPARDVVSYEEQEEHGESLLCDPNQVITSTHENTYEL